MKTSDFLPALNIFTIQDDLCKLYKVIDILGQTILLVKQLN